MRLGAVDFPKELIESRGTSSLVVFAGAGVSMPPPSNLPDFSTLAIELAQRTATLEKDEPLDRFLGRLEPELRIHIHERARRRLSSPDSKPNPLHFSLLKLFGGAGGVRLVTTNFDNHFAAAADEMWDGGGPEIFVAPALPVGGDFLGLVHLHGSVMRDPKRLVLTDVDFGKAYLTQGWARRFLQEMFLKYSVLFVGYSHNDPVMHYLARGLPSSTEGKRFALTLEGEDKWKHLGIVALTYPKGHDDDLHSGLRLALDKWVALTAERPLDKRSRIREIVSKPPPRAGEDNDYLVDALNDESTVRHFTEFALTVEWFEWAQQRDAFLRLFRDVSDEKNPDSQLAWWFATRFAVDHGGRALEWIARNELTLGLVCWLAVARTISMRMRAPEGCPRLDQWVPLLIRECPGDTDVLWDILSQCRYPRDATAALLLFKYLLRPEVELKPDRTRLFDPTREPDIDLDLSTPGDFDLTRLAWRGYFLPNLEEFAAPLVAIAAAHLEETALLSRAYHKSWDLVSMRFHDLTATSLYLRRTAIAVLLDVARETLLWLIQHAPKRADGVIESWWNAVSPVLKRLAVLGVARSAGWAADEKLGWLLDRDLLYRAGFWSEVGAVLNAAFLGASSDVKDSIVVAVLAGPANDREDRNEIILRRLWALNRADPECGRVLEELSKIPQPPENVPEPESIPPSPHDLGARPPADQIDELLDYELRHAEERDGGGLMAAVRTTVSEKPEWGIELGKALRERGLWETALWSSIIPGWNRDALTFDQWASVLQLLQDSKLLTAIALDEVVDLLERRTSADSNPFKGPLIGPALSVGLEVWETLQLRQHEKTPKAKDWLFVAINDAGGKIAEFYLRMLWQARREAGDAWRGLTADSRSCLESIIRGDSWAAEMARVVIAGNVHVLFALDPRWTDENAVRLFDWGKDTRRAEQAWHGYLTWGNWNNDLLERILPYCRATFPRIEEDLGDHDRQFCELMAAIALYGVVDPMESGWLPEFVRTAVPDARSKWASALREGLESFPSGKRREVWARWMKRYWELRLGAVPALDAAGELVPMIEWSIELEDAFPEAVRLILKGPAAQSGDMTRPCLRLQKSGVWRSYPRESGRLLLFLAQSQSRLQFGDYILELVKELAPLGAETAVLVDVCQRLAELGDSRAEDLRLEVESFGKRPGS